VHLWEYSTLVRRLISHCTYSPSPMFVVFRANVRAGYNFHIDPAISTHRCHGTANTESLSAREAVKLWKEVS
jgi:hypothetical protein